MSAEGNPTYAIALTDRIVSQSYLREKLADFMAEIRKGRVVTVFGGSKRQPHVGGELVCLIRRDLLADLIAKTEGSRD